MRIAKATSASPKGVHDADHPDPHLSRLFGNRCLRLVAPAGDLTIWGDATIEDDGKTDPAISGAREVPVADLPDECLVYLMGSRYCETDKLSQAAWDMFGAPRPAGDACRRCAISSISHIKFDYHAGAIDQDARSKRSTSASACAAISPISR